MNNATNFRTTVQILFKIELAEWEAGNKQWSVNNQFDETVLESALRNTENAEAIETAFNLFGDNVTENNIMSIAHCLSSFETPEINSAWVD